MNNKEITAAVDMVTKTKPHKHVIFGNFFLTNEKRKLQFAGELTIERTANLHRSLHLEILILKSLLQFD